MSYWLAVSLLILFALAAAGPPPGEPAARAPGLYATLHTSKGKIVIRLFEEKTPKTVENFVQLVTGKKPWKDHTGKTHRDEPFYNGLLFHRVLPNFMIQTGAHLPNGGYRQSANIPDEFHPDMKFDRPGRMGMANIGQPSTGNSQFFLTHQATDWLDGKHTVFGQVVEGQDVVEAIGNAPRDANDRPKEPILLEKVTLERVGSPPGSN
ncbi:peptidylprolyl isomerase [Acidobacteriia bacterium AH_259_A11_L15]|nr:peptidylprolyl isomerase [Acidobacteriia bacterium AH_259_A11_L15]